MTEAERSNPIGRRPLVRRWTINIGSCSASSFPRRARSLRAIVIVIDNCRWFFFFFPKRQKRFSCCCDPAMGNTSGSQRHKSAGLIAPSSPTKEAQSQAFVFDKNSDVNALHEAKPLFTKNTSKPNVRIASGDRSFGFALTPCCPHTRRTMISSTACRAPCRPTTRRTKCCRPCSDGRVAANRCSSAARFRNGNRYRWSKGALCARQFFARSLDGRCLFACFLDVRMAPAFRLGNNFYFSESLVDWVIFLRLLGFL